jgi:hypothetical protein
MTRIIVALLALAALPSALAAQSPEDVRAALEPHEDEPEVSEVVTAVLAHSEIDPARARDAIERARLSGLLPVTGLTLRQGQGYDLLARQTDTTGTTSVTSGQDLAFVASLSFRFDRLVYAGDERALLREGRTAAERRMELIGEIVRLYFERRRLVAERALSGELVVEREARIAEIAALFQVLSGGSIVMP